MIGDLLARSLDRAPRYDQENSFFQEDFDELKAAGYLNIAVPTELGGEIPDKFANLESAGKWELGKKIDTYPPLPKGELEFFHHVWAYEVA